MSWFENLLPDKISEQSFQSLVLVLLGVILLIVGVLEKIEMLGIQLSPNFTLRIIAQILGLFLITFGFYCLIKGVGGNKIEDLQKNMSMISEDTRMKIGKIEREVNDIENKVRWLNEKIGVMPCIIDELKRNVESLNGFLKLPTYQDVSTINNGRAFLVMEKCIDSESKMPEPEIIDAFSKASPEARSVIFGTIRSYRKDMVHKLLQLKNEEKAGELRRKISNLAILFQILAEIEQHNDNQNFCLHEIFVNIAYVYKDIKYPNWDRALKFIELAIDTRNKGNFDRKFYIDYEINRMLCNINLQKCDLEKCENINKDFNWIWSFEDGRNRIMTVPPEIFPNFYEWMAKYKMKNITEWLIQHPDKQDDWFNMFESEQFKEKVRKSIQ